MKSHTSLQPSPERGSCRIQNGIVGAVPRLALSLSKVASKMPVPHQDYSQIFMSKDGRSLADWYRRTTVSGVSLTSDVWSYRDVQKYSHLVDFSDLCERCVYPQFAYKGCREEGNTHCRPGKCCNSCKIQYTAESVSRSTAGSVGCRRLSAHRA